MIFGYFLDILQRLYYFLFDRFILYPLLSQLHLQFNIQFMNLGYQPRKDESFHILDQLLEANDCCKANVALYEKALSLYPKYPNFDGLQLLEVGCGQGGGIEWISRAHSFATVNGIDPIVVNSFNGKITRGNAEKLSFADDSFDIILNIESSHLYGNCQRFFLECSRVLRKNGFLCWADLRYAHQLKKLLETVEQSSLRLITIEDITKEVLRGIELTSVRYDALLQNSPFFIGLFEKSIRTTYCAPGTRSYERFLKREKVYICACWQNCKNAYKFN